MASELTTTPYTYTSPDYDIEVWDMFDYVDRSAFLGFYITFIVLAAIANVLVVAAIVRLFITQPIMRTSAKHVAVVFCCLTCLLTTVFPEPIIANFHLNRKLNSREQFFTCGEDLMVEVSAYLLTTLAHLLVAVVIMAEALRIQQWVKLGRKAQLVVTMVLCLMAIVYVAVVLTTVFYKVTLADSKNPCDEYGYVIYSADEKTRRAMPAVEYLVPTAAVIFAVVLLLIAYISKSSTAAMTTTPGHLASVTNNPPMPARRQFPADAVLAGLVVVVFPFVFFFNAFAAWDLEPRMEWSTRIKLWAAGRLLGLLSLVLIPCCWLLDPTIRADWRRCCRGRPRADHVQDTPEPMGIQKAGYAENHTRL